MDLACVALCVGHWGFRLLVALSLVAWEGVEMCDDFVKKCTSGSAKSEGFDVFSIAVGRCDMGVRRA